MRGKLTALRDRLLRLPRVRVRSTITKAGLPRMEEAIEGLLADLPFELALALETSVDPVRAFTVEDAARAGDTVRKWVKKCFAAGDHAKPLRFGLLRSAIGSIHRGEAAGLGCGAGLSSVAVAADGGLFACHRFTGLDAGMMGSLDHAQPRPHPPARSPDLIPRPLLPARSEPGEGVTGTDDPSEAWEETELRPATVGRHPIRHCRPPVYRLAPPPSARGQT